MVSRLAPNDIAELYIAARRGGGGEVLDTDAAIRTEPEPGAVTRDGLETPAPDT